MKKYIISIFLSALLFGGCTLDREPLTGPSTGSFPASAEEAQAGVLAAYKSLANNLHQYGPADRWYDQLTDIGAMRTTLSGWPNFVLSSITSSTSHVCDTYARVYKGLGRIHLVLDNLDKLRGVISEEEYLCYKAELLCLRAYQYDTACKFFGDVPWIDHCLTLDDYAYARTPREQIIERILDDMDDELIEALPVAWDKSAWGTCRVGRVGAYALKARICLEWGYFEDAAKYSKRALDLAAGLYDLTPLDCTYYPTHADGEPDQTPLFGFDAEVNSREWIWSIQFDRLAASNTHAGIYTNASRVHNGAAGRGPSQAMMDSFQCTDGLSIVESPLYNWQDPWANRDPRLDLYCQRPGSRCMGIQLSTDPNDKTVYDYIANKAVLNADANPTVNKYEYGPNGEKGPGGYLWRKFVDPRYYGSVTGKDYEDELDMPIIRLAELLLVDAEANIEMEGGDLTRAKANIERVRARVNMPALKDASRDGLRSALRYERKIELCCEGFRWFDIRRWKDAEGRPIAYKALHDVQQIAPAFGKQLCNAKPYIDENWVVTYEKFESKTDDKGKVTYTPHQYTFDGKDCNARVHTITKFNLNKDELWPFPYDEMVTNPLIGLGNNNPGY
ncbi:MAG: RagB/SusD family nutrient uptake outer membrane protein [Alistipes sp.]|nr:RagB/SusD family nutrient uptake outer membrane protein [Alistipes sp.]